MISTYWSSEKWDTVGTKVFREGFVEKRDFSQTLKKPRGLRLDRDTQGGNRSRRNSVIESFDWESKSDITFHDLINRYLLSICHLSGTVLHVEAKMMSKRSLSLRSLHSSEGYNIYPKKNHPYKLERTLSKL